MVNLQELRDQTGRLQQDVAEELGISREYLSKLENKKRKLTREMAEKMAALYQVSPAEILGYQMEDSSRELRDERDSFRDRLSRVRKEHARELQVKQNEIDALNKQVDQLRHDLEYMQSVCKMLLKKGNSPAEDPTDEENG